MPTDKPFKYDLGAYQTDADERIGRCKDAEIVFDTRAPLHRSTRRLCVVPRRTAGMTLMSVPPEVMRYFPPGVK